MQIQMSKKLLMALTTVLCVSAENAFAQETSTAQKSREEIRAIMDKCFESAGMEKPAQGQRPTAPTDEQRQVVDACMKENGVQPPSHHGGGRPHREAASVQ